MNLPASLFPQGWLLAGQVVAFGLLIWAVRLAPWSRLAVAGRLNIWLGCIVVLTLLWSMKAGVQPGLSLHLVGATMMTLMFGPGLAVVGLAAVLAAVTLNGGGDWAAIGLTTLISIAVPVGVAYAVHRAVTRFLPANFFVYVFVGAFFGAAVSVVAAGLASSALFSLADAYPSSHLLSEYLLFFVLLGFAEAWLNGAAITLMVVYVPHWVTSFDDKVYLAGK